MVDRLYQKRKKKLLYRHKSIFTFCAIKRNDLLDRSRFICLSEKLSIAVKKNAR